MQNAHRRKKWGNIPMKNSKLLLFRIFFFECSRSYEKKITMKYGQIIFKSSTRLYHTRSTQDKKNWAQFTDFTAVDLVIS